MAAGRDMPWKRAREEAMRRRSQSRGEALQSLVGEWEEGKKGRRGKKRRG